MITPNEILGSISGGRILDIATGSGNFIHFLLAGLKDYREIIGIDTNERAATAFSNTFKDKTDIHFALVDALKPPYDDESFDMVCISNSLHHFENPQIILNQMLRLLLPGGYLITAEMYRDGQTETQMTHVLLHHWWAAVDQLTGVIHNETYQREAILTMIAHLKLSDLTLYDLADLEENPKSPDILDELNPVIDRYIQRAERRPDLQTFGEELRQRICEVGFHSATTLLLIGKKP
jgi:ubiquinone/menaquinone biosynthesis C-methylase UbiE